MIRWLSAAGEFAEAERKQLHANGTVDAGTGFFRTRVQQGSKAARKTMIEHDGEAYGRRAERDAAVGTPEIFNTDQGSQFTGNEFIGRLKDAGVRISMDGKGRWLDNVFKRLWRSVKYEKVYLNAYDTVADAR